MGIEHLRRYSVQLPRPEDRGFRSRIGQTWSGGGSAVARKFACPVAASAEHNCDVPERVDQPSYAAAGVDVARARTGLIGLLGWVQRTLPLRSGTGRSVLPIGYFANVVDLGGGRGLAISTDGVGTKLLVAQRLDRYDTIGIDCVAMNVNDVLCVGAEPISLVDYLAVEDPEPRLLDELGQGLFEGARRAG